jgi:hypothetical protein
MRVVSENSNALPYNQLQNVFRGENSSPSFSEEDSEGLRAYSSNVPHTIWRTPG